MDVSDIIGEDGKPLTQRDVERTTKKLNAINCKCRKEKEVIYDEDQMAFCPQEFCPYSAIAK